jgi:hypothetical protein
MLIGRYPFAAPNDKQLFKKMLTADFSIPDEYSDSMFQCMFVWQQMEISK